MYASDKWLIKCISNPEKKKKGVEKFDLFDLPEKVAVQILEYNSCRLIVFYS